VAFTLTCDASEAAGLEALRILVVDDDAVDAAEQPRPRGRPRTSTTSIVEQKGVVATCSAQARAGNYAKELEGFEVVARQGKRPGRPHYEPLFPYFAGRTRTASGCSAGDFVDTDDGTGVVHMAPGFGEDDQRSARRTASSWSARSTTGPLHRRGARLARAATCSTPTSIDHQGPEGARRRAAAPRDLRPQLPALLAHREPLIYKAMSSWFVEVTAIKDRMVEHNQQINWIPEHVATASSASGWRTRATGRSRATGSGAAPIPVWKSDDPKPTRASTSTARSPSSSATSACARSPTCTARSSTTWCAQPDDPTGKSTMRRVAEVLDCWFESGSMPFAQVHYPFENKPSGSRATSRPTSSSSTSPRPAAGSTRCTCWRRAVRPPPFSNVICHGVVLDENGRSCPSRCATTRPRRGVREDGADALRWFLMSSPILRGGDLQIAEGRQADPRGRAPGAQPDLERLLTSSPPTRTSTEVFTGLTGERSVHLTDWPEPDELPADPELVDAMDRVRAVASAVLSQREDRRLRTRLPLAELVVAGASAHSLEPFTGLIADELNVKTVRLEDDASAFAQAVLRPNARLLGPRLGKSVQQVLAAARAGDWATGPDGTVEAAGEVLAPEEYELAMVSTGDDDARATTAVRMVDPEGHAVDLGLVVSLDLTLTDELIAEGRSRDVVRAIQQARKDAGFRLTDRIRVSVASDSPELAAAIEAHRGHIAAATLADEFEFVEGDRVKRLSRKVDVDGAHLAFEVAQLG
jgi:isoleucyl-tRNA synthetase